MLFILLGFAVVIVGLIVWLSVDRYRHDRIPSEFEGREPGVMGEGQRAQVEGLSRMNGTNHTVF